MGASRGALWAALVVAGVLAGVAAIQYGLALRTVSGSASAAAPAEHAANAKAVLAEPVPAVVPLSALQWIVPVTLGAAALLIPLALGLWSRSLAALQAEAVLRAGVDPLTGLGAHRLFREELSRQCAIAVRRDRRLSLALFDIDQFAVLNEVRGVRHGDAVLAGVGAVLRAGRSEDLAFRLGGDEFAVLFPHTTAAEASVAVDRIRASVAGRLPGTTVSAGLAQLEPEAPGPDSLLAQAELALHDAKAAGRDRLVVFDASGIRATR